MIANSSFFRKSSPSCAVTMATEQQPV